MSSNPTWVLTVVTIKMWFRARTAMFWNFVIPIIIMAIFGVLNFGPFSSVNLGIVDEQEMPYVRKVLNAAAMTYVAATLQSILTLLYYIMRFAGSRR